MNKSIAIAKSGMPVQSSAVFDILLGLSSVFLVDESFYPEDFIAIYDKNDKTRIWYVQFDNFSSRLDEHTFIVHCNVKTNKPASRVNITVIADDTDTYQGYVNDSFNADTAVDAYIKETYTLTQYDESYVGKHMKIEVLLAAA